MRKSQKLKASPSLPISPLTDQEISSFLTELDEARQDLDALEKSGHNLSPTEIMARRTHLTTARKKVNELKAHMEYLRGDHHLPVSPPEAVTPNTIPVKIDGRMKIQAEAYEYWIRLKATGANPTINSTCESMARWCADNGVTTHTGVSPRAGTIRNSILGGSSGWTPPTHSRDQAKEHVAQLAQVAQPSPADPA
jgi:hypothetical protein